MSGFIENFKRGLAGDDTHRYQVAGVGARCSHCGGEDFERGTALLNSALMTLLGIDWADKRAYLLICQKCGHIDWFKNEPELV